MAKKQEPRREYTGGGTVNLFPLNTYWFKEIPILLAYNKSSTEKEFMRCLSSILEKGKTPFWVNRRNLIKEIGAAYKKSGKDGFYEDEGIQLIRLILFKEELATVAENEYEKKFELLEELLEAKLSIDDRDDLNAAANKFLMMEATSDKPVTLNQSKAACEVLSNILPDAIIALKLDLTTRERLCNISPKSCHFYLDSDFFIDGLISVWKAAEKLTQQEPTEKDKKRPPKYTSLMTFIKTLATIYKKVTGKNAGATNSEHSNFVEFTIKCVSLTLDKEIPKSLIKGNNPQISSEYSKNSINRAAVHTIAILKNRTGLENSLGYQIPLTETTEGMLKALHETRAKNHQKDLDFINKKRKK